MALIKCPDCQSDVSSIAPACPKCGRPIEKNEGPRASIYSEKEIPIITKKTSLLLRKDKKSQWAFLIILGIVVSILLYVTREKSDETPLNHNVTVATLGSTAVKPEPVYSITVIKIFDAYEKNEVAADEAMRGHVIFLSGAVQSVDKNFLGDIVLMLETSNELMPAGMTLSKDQTTTAAALSKGDIVALNCSKMTRTMGSPSGSDCQIRGHMP